MYRRLFADKGLAAIYGVHAVSEDIAREQGKLDKFEAELEKLKDEVNFENYWFYSDEAVDRRKVSLLKLIDE